MKAMASRVTGPTCCIALPTLWSSRPTPSPAAAACEREQRGEDEQAKKREGRGDDPGGSCRAEAVACYEPVIGRDQPERRGKQQNDDGDGNDDCLPDRALNRLLDAEPNLQRRE